MTKKYQRQRLYKGDKLGTRTLFDNRNLGFYKLAPHIWGQKQEVNKNATTEVESRSFQEALLVTTNVQVGNHDAAAY